jgi:flagellar basal body-associated protein FliL
MDMAEPETPAKNEKTPEPAAPKKKGGMTAVLPWLIPVGAAVLFVVLGFAVGRLFGTRGKAQDVSAAEHVTVPEAQVQHESKEGPGKSATWFYDTEAVIVNLNESGLSRYLRVSLTLELGNGLIEKEGLAFLDQKKPVLKNWITLFLSNETVDDIRGAKNLQRILTKITDMFNQGLWPDSKPHIVAIYLKEWSIQ